jgi:hypothetical protein
LPSIGSPSALTTRPSHPTDGRTAPGTAETRARHPRRTPSSGANGIKSAKGPENPTTSLGIFLPGVSIITRAPTDIACSGPATSNHQPAHADNAAVDLDAVKFVDLFGQRLHGAPAGKLQMVTFKLRVLTLYLPGPLIIASSLGDTAARQARLEGRVTGVG